MSTLPLHQEIPIVWIYRDPEQPRKTFETEALKELAHNIKQVGLLQPLLVQQDSLQHFTLLCGERRLIAAKQAGLDRVPVVIHQKYDSPSLTRLIQYSENIFREALTALESIDVIVKLVQEGISTQQLAQVLGKRHDWVKGHLLANTNPYRSLFESGRLKSVAVLLIFKSLPLDAQRHLLTDSCPITSTLCQKIRQQYQQKSTQKEIPILSEITAALPKTTDHLTVRSTITIPLNPLWLRGFLTKKSLICAIEKIVNDHLILNTRQA